MKKLFVFWAFVGMLTFSCNQKDGYEEKQVEETVDMEQKVRDFFAIDEAFYQSLLEDPDFVKLCDVYKEQSSLSLEDLDAGLSREDEIFDMIDSLSVKYERDNIFAYVMHYEEQEVSSRSANGMPDYYVWETVNVTQHYWGRCYLNSPTGVCDIVRNWQDAWTWCARIEIQANQRLGNQLDLNAYRNALKTYLASHKPNFYYGIFYDRYRRYYNPLLAGGYDEVINMPLSAFVFDIQTYAFCSDSRICEFVIFLRKQFEQFHYSGLWKSYGGGGGTTGNNPAIGAPGSVINMGNVVEDPYIGCILRNVLNNKRVSDILKNFMGEHSIAHLKWDLSNSKFDTLETGRFEPNMDKFWFTIKLNEEWLSKLPVLLVAQTMIHEAIHADLFMKMYMFRESMPKETMSKEEIRDLDHALSVQDFPTLYEFYNQYYSAGDVAGVHHQYMASYMVSEIAGILQEIFPGQVYMVYEAIAWQGLKKWEVLNIETNKYEPQNTTAWDELPSERKDALNDCYRSYWKNPNSYKLEGCL